MNREDWLNAALEKFRPHFTTNKLEIPIVHVSCGFPSSGGLAKNRVRGECWKSECTPDGSRHIFISPIESDPVEVLGILVHETLHSCLGDEVRHGKKFKEAMKLLGLEGKARSAMPGEHLHVICEKIVVELGEYPHTALKPKPPKDRKNTKKTFKLFCPKKRDCEKGCLILDNAKDEDYTVSVSKKSLKLGMPQCPCSNEMIFEEEDYELYKALAD